MLDSLVRKGHGDAEEVRVDVRPQLEPDQIDGLEVNYVKVSWRYSIVLKN